MSTSITVCRICRNADLIPIFDLGSQALGSRFPKAHEPTPIEAPLVLVKCNDFDDPTRCGLIQLRDTVASDELYLHSYGYRSGLNNTMINHLTNLVREIEQRVVLSTDDLVIDIGSNDATLLKSYSSKVDKVGIDPTGIQFKQYYTDDITLLPDFFTKNSYTDLCGTRKAKVITTISMFYDLPDPFQFAREIKDILAEDGLWVSEQSYCKTMLERNSFDTVCHEHLEYYMLKQFDYLASAVGLKILDVSLNDCNGGSFRITLTHTQNSLTPNTEVLNKLRAEEQILHTPEYFDQFINRITTLKTELVSFLKEQKAHGKTIYLYGASTKGNTLLQYFGLDHTLITAVAERNPEKYGARTPKTNIPIIPEAEMRQANPDFLLVLPWHFKREFIEREQLYLEQGGTLIFPLPNLEFITNKKKL
jgi:NDP-4-keto-2,6-dideoxyhexose 3-C-methyltransferase